MVFIKKGLFISLLLVATFAFFMVVALVLIIHLYHEVHTYTSANVEVVNSISKRLAEDQVVLVACTQGHAAADCCAGKWQIKVLNLHLTGQIQSTGLEHFTYGLNDRAFTIAVHEWLEGNESVGLAILRTIESCQPDFYYSHPSFKAVHIQRMRRGMETGFSSDKSLEKILQIINNEYSSAQGYWQAPSAILASPHAPQTPPGNIGPAREWMLDHAKEYFDWLEGKRPHLKFLVENINVVKRRILTDASNGLDRPYAIYEVKYGDGGGVIFFGYSLEVNNEYLPKNIVREKLFQILLPAIGEEGLGFDVFAGRKVFHKQKSLKMLIQQMMTGDRLLLTKKEIEETPIFIKFPTLISKGWVELVPIRSTPNNKMPDSYELCLQRYLFWLQKKYGYLRNIPEDLILRQSYFKTPVKGKMGTFVQYWIKAGETENLFSLIYIIQTDENQIPVSMVDSPCGQFYLMSSKTKTVEKRPGGKLTWNHYRGLLLDADETATLMIRLSKGDKFKELIEKARTADFISTTQADRDKFESIMSEL